MTTPPILLIDAPSLYFRAYFGVPESAASDVDGRPVNAIRGFVDMLATLIRTRRPDRMVCALDNDWRPAWRVKLIDSYKKHRLTPSGGEEVPDNLTPQIPTILDVLAAIGIPAIGADGYEADDVLGTLATTQPGPVEVVSGDRDLFQLIDDAKPVRLLYVGRGVANLEVCDNAYVDRRYGVPAAGYADFAALRGDPSDGLPGVSGVGEKTAARLIARYGTPRRHGRRARRSGRGLRPGRPDEAPRRPRLPHGRAEGRRRGARRQATQTRSDAAGRSGRRRPPAGPGRALQPRRIGPAPGRRAPPSGRLIATAPDREADVHAPGVWRRAV